MEAGRIVQIGPPREIYARPASRFVAGFIGDTNLFEGRAVGRENGWLAVRTGEGAMMVRDMPDVAPGATVWLAVRPERVRLGALADHNCLDVRVERVEYRGDQSILHGTTVAGTPLRLKGDNAALASVAVGSTVSVAWVPDDVVVLQR
jgi:putrescine transport system ATP-binding protein